MKLWGAIANGLVKRGGAVMITIATAQGSCPRDAGARMVVFGDGTFTGTIGGGTLEWRAIAEAQRLLSKRVTIPQDIDADLTTGYSTRSYALGPELGQCCGGHVRLDFELIPQVAADGIAVLADQEACGTFKTTTWIEGPFLRRRIVSNTHPVSAPSRLDQFGEPMRALVLFGAGHVGRAIVLALNALPFRVLWVDQRADAFPSAVPANVTLIAPADPVAMLATAPDDSFVLIMTHSHELDLELTDAALRAGRFAYVGLIGSATKRARFERRLIEAGLSRSVVDDLVCPIGDLGPKSKLPAVIAAATVVELLVKDEMCRKVDVSAWSSDATGQSVSPWQTGGQSSGS